MQEAFSRLKAVLDSKNLSVADLVRRVSDQGDRINAKSLYRLADPEEPLEKVDMRVIAAICQALSVGIGDLLTFDEPEIIERFSLEKQAHMDELMARHQNKNLPVRNSTELRQLQVLVEEAESVALGNARRLANRRRRLLRAEKERRPVPENLTEKEIS